jgi:hypothetical protein
MFAHAALVPDIRVTLPLLLILASLRDERRMFAAPKPPNDVYSFSNYLSILYSISFHPRLFP